MIAQPNSQRRSFHRVRFPIAEQPRWIVGNTSFTVIDLSETSCRLDLRGIGVIDDQRPISGFLRFTDGDQVWIEGNVLRREPQELIVQFTKGVSFKKLMSVQRELLRKYPALRDANSADSVRSQ